LIGLGLNDKLGWARLTDIIFLNIFQSKKNPRQIFNTPNKSKNKVKEIKSFKYIFKIHPLQQYFLKPHFTSSSSPSEGPKISSEQGDLTLGLLFFFPDPIMDLFAFGE
jgi:hypothetical protein